MGQLIESLESRTLLSATPAALGTDFARLGADAKQITTDLNACSKTASADVKVLAADLKRLKASKATLGLVTTLKTDEKTLQAKLKKDASSLNSAGAKDLVHIVSDYKKLQKKPGNAALQAQLSTDVTKLESDAAAQRQKLLTDATNADDTEEADLHAVAVADATDLKTQTDVSTAQNNAATCATTAQNDVNRLQTDVATFAHDLGL